MNETERTLTEADVEAIAVKVNQKLFETFGFDISTPRGRLEAQGAFRYLMFWYRISGWIVKGIATIAATSLGGWILYKLFGSPTP